MSDQKLREQPTVDRIENLVSDLAVNRSSRSENALCKEIRPLSGSKRMEVVQALASFNVRLGADVAARVHLPVYYQVQLVRNLLADGGSNTIKQFVVRLFVHRMKTAVVIKELMAAKYKYPNAVSLMAYYYSTLKRVRCRAQKDALFLLRDFRTRGV
ncbi:hypothetical protein [Pseudomonas sp. BJa3]|uniref:hypothetical protein n=1 Tax=Pseudomonas sp. BJa3 TaxID=2986525 RepID=UPI002265ED52|nr:hypothetical protein [Pseudomonas sp. BJa3]MCX5509381.1 hypothetical protein [Pseudomonas sp. BJa3]